MADRLADLGPGFTPSELAYRAHMMANRAASQGSDDIGPLSHSWLGDLFHERHEPSQEIYDLSRDVVQGGDEDPTHGSTWVMHPNWGFVGPNRVNARDDMGYRYLGHTDARQGYAEGGEIQTPEEEYALLQQGAPEIHPLQTMDDLVRVFASNGALPGVPDRLEAISHMHGPLFQQGEPRSYRDIRGGQVMSSGYDLTPEYDEELEHARHRTEEAEHRLGFWPSKAAETAGALATPMAMSRRGLTLMNAAERHPIAAMGNALGGIEGAIYGGWNGLMNDYEDPWFGEGSDKRWNKMWNGAGYGFALGNAGAALKRNLAANELGHEGTNLDVVHGAYHGAIGASAPFMHRLGEGISHGITHGREALGHLLSGADKAKVIDTGIYHGVEEGRKAQDEADEGYGEEPRPNRTSSHEAAGYSTGGQATQSQAPFRFLHPGR